MSSLQEIKVQQSVGGDMVNVQADEKGNIYTADIARSWTAKGYGWQAMATTAIVALIVRPTTVAAATFYNNTSKNFVIDRVFGFNLISIANGQFGIWLCVHPIGMTAPTNDMTVRNSLSGLVAGTEGIFDSAATVNDNGWFPWGISNYSVTATVPGTLVEAEVGGRIIIPPTAGISMQSVGQTAVVTVAFGLTYYSVPVSEFARA